MSRIGLMALVAASLGLAGCGGGDGGGGTGISRADVRDAGVEYARCMREHGIDVPDPKPGAGGVGSILVGRDQQGAPGFADARDACRRFLRGFASKASDDQLKDIMDARLDFARCMRSKGFDVPDPRPGAQLGTGGGSLGKLDLHDPRVTSAMSACSKGLRTLATGR